jgi:transposase InsO family protein
LASTDWRHLGRLAGFTNQKPARRTPDRYAPWVKLVHARVCLAPRAEPLLQSIRQRAQPPWHPASRFRIDAVVAMKQRNPRWGCPRIAQQITLAFGVEIHKDVVRRILSAHYRPESDSAGPSWLAFIGHTKDSLWSCDLFRCESATLRTYWVLVVMDQCTRRIIGFGVQRGIVDGVALCRMFRGAIRGQGPPKYLSSDHDPLYRFHQWKANLRV